MRVTRLALVLALAGAAPAAMAAISPSDISLDSRLELIEHNTYGAYKHYEITMVTRYGETTLLLNRDGEKAEVAVPLQEVVTLWEQLIASDLETLTDAPTGQLPPDQSHFTVRFSVAGADRRIRAYGVDFLKDGRYREIVVAILELADAYLAEATKEDAP